MNLRLLKEAQIASTMDKSELALLEQVKVILNKDSVCDLLESFRPSEADYQKWLSVIVGQAADTGLNINRKGSFLDVAFEMFENDPEPPPYDMQEMIASKLWMDYKSARHGAKLEKIAQAQEDEEEMASVMDRLHQPADELDDSMEDDAVPADQEVNMPPDEDAADIGGDFDLDDSPEEIGGEQQEELPLSGQEALDSITAILQRVLGGTPKEDQQFDQYEEDPEPPQEDMPPEESELPQEDEFEEDQPQLRVEEEEEVAAPEKEAKPKATLLHQMLSGPRATISQAQKEIEAEGEAAWKGHHMPTNPHPAKSIAHAAWERGMKRAAKTHFGLDEKPVVTSKQKRKKV